MLGHKQHLKPRMLLETCVFSEHKDCNLRQEYHALVEELPWKAENWAIRKERIQKDIFGCRPFVSRTKELQINCILHRPLMLQEHAIKPDVSISGLMSFDLRGDSFFIVSVQRAFLFENPKSNAYLELIMLIINLKGNFKRSILIKNSRRPMFCETAV